MSLIALLLLVNPALAGSRHQAEAIRLYEEIDRLAQKNAWSGVERNYRHLLQLEVDWGIPVPLEQHLLAAEAARSMGDVNARWRRLSRAKIRSPVHPRVLEGMAEIFAYYGVVQLKVSKRWEGPVELVAKDMPFEPDRVNAIQAARKALAEERRFHGLLPLGRYMLGPVPFGIVGAEEFKVVLKPGAGTP